MLQQRIYIKSQWCYWVNTSDVTRPQQCITNRIGGKRGYGKVNIT